MTSHRFLSQTRRGFLHSGLALATAGWGGLRPARATGAAPTEAALERVSPVEDLMREHGVLNRVLVIYEETIRRLTTGGEVPPEAVRDAAKIVREYVEGYHEQLEQDFLFPRFTNAGQMTGLVQELLKQHLGGRNLTDRALHLAKQSLKTVEDRRQLAEVLGNFVHMYHAHEAREDTELFPAFRTLVSPHEYAALREDFDKREREVFGQDSFAEMLNRVAGIEKQLGIDDLAKFTRGL